MPTKTDDDAAFWDALYEKEVPPSTWDDHRELDEAPGDNFAPNGADKDAGARLQIGELDQQYQAAVDDVAAKLTAIEADPTLAKPASREALVWLGENAALLGYFLGGTAAAITHDALALKMGRHRGMYRPPQASEDASAARGLLHNRLMALIANQDVGAASSDAPELREALNRILWIVRAGFLDHLGRQFAETKNPAYAWHAVRLALPHKMPLPDWLAAYLCACAEGIYREGEREEFIDDSGKKRFKKSTHAAVAQALGFINPNNENKFIGPLRAPHTDLQKLSVYMDKRTLEQDNIKPDSILYQISKTKTLSEKTVTNYAEDINSRIRTDKPYTQET